MANFAVVAPLNIVEKLKEGRTLGFTHLLLAHDVVAYPTKYRGIFHPDNMRHPERNVILDTSVVELGKAVDASIMIEAAHIVQPTTIVLPDVPLKQEETVCAVHEALFTWGPKLLGKGVSSGYMLCPQGKDITEYIQCAEAFARHPKITSWGVPRDAMKIMPSRQQLVRLFNAINPVRKIHLLGFSDNMMDDVVTARMPQVSSIDSAVPLRSKRELSLTTIMQPRGDWWETATYDDIIAYNLWTVRGWVGDKFHFWD